MIYLDATLARTRRAFDAFAARCRSGEIAYRLTPADDESPYARCFGIYCRHLTGDRIPEHEHRALALAIRQGIRDYRTRDIDTRAKGYRQLLAFSLSALSVLGALREDPLEELVREQIPDSIQAGLDSYGCLEGRPGSGNQAMFTAVFLLHSRDQLGLDVGEKLDEWTSLHVRAMNRFGFWGDDQGMTHLQFQNGYHQYEILEYLNASNPRLRESIAAVRSLADADAHFAPYPGGGGCYDYDAVFLLTPNGMLPDDDDETRAVLTRTANTLVAEQLPDGGFAESLSVRPRSGRQIRRAIAHVVHSHNPRLFAERLRYALTLQRPKHSSIRTHWSPYARRWDESDLWDSWFRMMTLARIQTAFDASAAANWGFLNYPGIGYHPSVRKGWPGAE